MFIFVMMEGQNKEYSSRKESVETTALQMIYKLGYKGLTMRRLAGELGFDPANLYNYFESKHTLLSDNLLFISKQFLNGVQTIKSAKLPFHKKVMALIHLYVDNAASYPYHVSLLINEWRNLQGDQMIQFITEKQQVEAIISDILVEHDSLACMDPTRFDWTVRYVLSSLRWVFPLFAEEQQPNPLELEDFIHSRLKSGVGFI